MLLVSEKTSFLHISRIIMLLSTVFIMPEGCFGRFPLARLKKILYEKSHEIVSDFVTFTFFSINLQPAGHYKLTKDSHV